MKTVKHSMEGLTRGVVLGILVLASMVAGANTGTVTATLVDGTFNVSFANHAHETNSLWVVYDSYDNGSGTNGWSHVERLGTVTPETNSWAYAAPAGWGTTVGAIRFILSEVPYDYDYSLDFIRSKTKERIILDDFDLYMNYRVCLQAMVFSRDTSNASFFTNRGEVNDQPYFTLFAIGGQDWRFDYNDKTGVRRSGIATDVLYNIETSSNGLYVNGNKINAMATDAAASTAKSKGRLELAWGGTGPSPGQNHMAHISFYGVQIYDAPTGGSLLVNLVPMVKGGRAGMYDTVRDVYYFSDTGTDYDLNYGPSRIESANPFFADAFCGAAVAAGPTVFTPTASATVSSSIVNADGGILDGPATLTLTGENNWGGSFIVSNGTLVAEFGQGLAATDCLRLETGHASSGNYGGYGGWNGHATASLGSGAGQICVTEGNYLAYCAADGGELEVDIGGEGAPWTPTAADRRLILNGMPGAGTLRFKNPIVLDEQHLILRVGFGTAIFEESIASVQSGGNARSVNCYGVDIASDGVGIFQGKGNHIYNFSINSGSYVFDAGSTNTIDGNLNMQQGAASSLVITNSMLNLTGADGGGAWLNVFGGKAELCRNGVLKAGGIYVGQEAEPTVVEALRPGLILRGKVMLEAKGSDALTKSYGSLNVRNTSRSDALVFEEGADVTMNNLIVHKRNVYHRGGNVKLEGAQGVCNMGKAGRARYWIYTGAELHAPCVKSESDVSPVHFIFIGGKLETTTYTPSTYFVNFGSDAVIMVASNYGGEFCTKHDTSMPKGMVEVLGDIGAPSGASNWNYVKAEWLTAPAFKKTGDKTLTMSGTNTYNCATDVADGTLRLAGGDTPGALPTNGVVRVTGGTLDLGGNTQTVRALLGTAGAVANGTLIAKEGIYPGGVGAVGSFTCGAALSGELHVDVDVSTGASDKIVADGTLDLSGIDLVLPGADLGDVQQFRLVEGATTGEFRSVSGLPNGWVIKHAADGSWAKKVLGMVIICR